ncbi:SDR family oxidoreductase [Chelatococcus reniformis]|uniref:Short-chain type dehydrogenase/reductase n=1 Tax=Chelatococcus reniformis TaxID=1494448 RepID=A0A916UVG9_9HYPH|nr:SDR family NAD(P)-dependent oxidoreductase [Chelatococcus reniformis]GGC89888.1 short-chain type dehydrogenase/reductase [Chelatococcus reniformis]
MTDVAGRTAFITGGANGIGLGIARALAGAGAKVALIDIDAEALERARAELAASTAVVAETLDMRDRASFADVADRVERQLGPVSLLINNAGVAGGAPALRLNYELWDWGLGINLGGVVSGIQTFLSRMAERGQGGHIVNTASGAGLVAGQSGVLYHTAKFAVVGMSEALKFELEPHGIGVSVLCPGPVATDIIARTRKLQPRVVHTMTQDEHESARTRSGKMTRWLERGVSPDAVGRMVLRAIQDDQLYILTDRYMAPLIEARTKALLSALPPE